MVIRMLLACFVMFSVFASAQAQNYTQNIEKLSELNKVNPLKSPKYEPSAKVLSRNILDRKNKVIGHVKDITIGNGGRVVALDVDLDRLRLGEISFNYQEMGIRTASNAYTLTIDDDQVANIYPQLLAQTETAAGGNAEIFSVRRMIGATVTAQDGRFIGEVSEVLFDDSATRVEALYIQTKAGGRHSDMAIPYSNAFTIKDEGLRKAVVVDNELAAAILAFSKN